MQKKRVVVTGIGAITAFGRTWAEVKTAFQRKENAVQNMGWQDKYPELEAQLGAPLPNYAPPSHWSRKQLRSMGRVSQLCVDAAEQALTQAGLLNNGELSPLVKNGNMGVASGSSTGSTADVRDMAELLMTGKSDTFNASTYVRAMPHTTAANVGIFFGLQGRIIPTSSACASGSQGIGYAYEAIKYGMIPMMLAGGGEEFCPSEVYVFDSLYAASRKNDDPKRSPCPYDQNRDGLVIGEGAGMFVLEELEHALARGANIIAELVGYGANSDGSHVTQPQAETMQRCMELALKDAGISPEQIGYVNGHGTATEKGDIAETQATEAVFGNIAFFGCRAVSVHVTNLDGFYNVLHPVMMPMIRRRKAGRIVCITSVSGIIGNRGQVNYSASKAGLIGAAKALAVELAKRKITVNCVAPGLIDTEILDENLPLDQILKAIPMERMGNPDEVAYAVSFLMDEKAQYITRQVIGVNGGLC